MTLINLGKVSLYTGMTRKDAELCDEEIKKNNHGKLPVDKNGKPLQTNVGLFTKYDKDKSNTIDEFEYQNYRNDMEKEMKDKLQKSEKELMKKWDDFKKGNVKPRGETTYIL